MGKIGWRKLASLVGIFWLVGATSTAFAQEFYVRVGDEVKKLDDAAFTFETIDRTETVEGEDGEVREKLHFDIEPTDVSLLEYIDELRPHDEPIEGLAELEGQRIEARQPTVAEAVVSIGAAAMSGMLMISSFSTYDLTDTFRLSSIRGVLMFIFPFETHQLYMKCGEEEVLVATTRVEENKIEENTKLHNLISISNACQRRFSTG